MNRAFWFPQFTSIGNVWSCLTIDNYVKDLHGGSTWIIFNIKNKLNHIQEVTKFWVNSPSITLVWDVLLRGRLCNFINVIVLVTVGYKSRLVRWREQKNKSPTTPRWPSSIGSSSNKGGRLERGGCGQQELTRPFVYLLFQKENTYLWEKSWEVAKHILPKVNEKIEGMHKTQRQLFQADPKIWCIESCAKFSASNLLFLRPTHWWEMDGHILPLGSYSYSSSHSYSSSSTG